MSTPVLWILFPAVLGGLLYLLRDRESLTQALGIATAVLLALLARLLPVDDALQLGPWTLEIADRLEVLGRRFVLGEPARPLLFFIYTSISLWFGASRAAHTSRLFVPSGLIMAALLVAALAVEPFLYAALLLVLAAMISVPLLSPPGKPTGRGVLRYLSFQMLGLPFLLFAGWIIEGSAAGAQNPELLMPAAVLLALGFAFFSGIFPFHAWVPMLAQETHPYAAGFVLFLLPGAVALFGLEFFSSYPWLNNVEAVFDILQFMGIIMVVFGGVWAAFQRNLARMFGFAILVEIGLSLVALSLPSTAESGRIEIYLGLLLPRGVSIAVWALSLTLLKDKTGGLYFRHVEGAARRLPIASAGLLLGHFSLAGFPLLAGFPIHLALGMKLAAGSLPAALLVLVGHAGLLACGLRTLGVLVTGPEEEGPAWQIGETRGQLVLLALGIASILLIGLLPQWFLPDLLELSAYLTVP